jgi:hypothetical protein
MICISGDRWVEIDKDFTKAQVVVEVEVEVNVDGRCMETVIPST